MADARWQVPRGTWNIRRNSLNDNLVAEKKRRRDEMKHAVSIMIRKGRKDPVNDEVLIFSGFSRYR